MKVLFKGLNAIVLSVGIQSGAGGVAGAAPDTCSNATLEGEYAFTVTTYTPPGVVAGIKTYDGAGKVTQRDYRGDSLRLLGQTDFSTPGQEKGIYSVNPDCTGSEIISLLVPGLSDGRLWIVFTISDGGHRVHEVVAKFIPPGSPVAVPTQTSAEVWKVHTDHEP
jgi:hypothetical protein